MGSAFNTSLYWLVGHHDGIEARAINNLRNHASQNNYGDGIDYWSPTVNMQRDPRWGRNQEVPGEDPMLTGQYAANFVQGLQGLSPLIDPHGHIMIVACCKHFLANSLENWEGHTRHNFDAKVPLNDLADYYLPAFKGCVMEGGSRGVMCSYNSVNGVPMCANTKYLNDTLRNSWRFDGYVTSDCDAVGDIYGSHHYTDPVNGTALALRAGTDMDCGDWGAHAYLKELPLALASGAVKQEDLDRALLRLTTLQMELGLYHALRVCHPSCLCVLRCPCPGKVSLAAAFPASRPALHRASPPYSHARNTNRTHRPPAALEGGQLYARYQGRCGWR